MSIYSHWILEERGKDFKFSVDFGRDMVFKYTYNWGGNDRTDRLKQIVRHDPKKGPREADLIVGEIEQIVKQPVGKDGERIGRLYL